MNNILEEAEWIWLHQCIVEEEQKILHDLEHSVDDNKKNFKHQYLGEPFEKGGCK